MRGTLRGGASRLLPLEQQCALALEMPAIRDVSHPTDDALAAEAAAFAAAVARPATPAIIEQALEQGFQQRSDVELNLGAYVGKVVHKPGTVTPAGAVGAEAQKIEEPSSQSDRL